MFDTIWAHVALTTAKAEDFILGVAFKFWVRLGSFLDVTVPVEIVYAQAPEDAEIRDELAKLTEQYLSLKEQSQARPMVVGGDTTRTGPNRPNAKKLSQREVNDIRYFKRSGWTNKAIADTFDINPATVSRIVRRQYHKTAV